MKRGCLISLIVLSVVLCIVVAVVGYLVLQTPAAQPLVLINSPQNGARVAVGQETIIQAVARGEQKIKRVELWVDGKLQDAQSSNLPGGTSPFPIVTNWRPPTPGAHSVIVRAFNVQGRQGQGSINVEAVQSGDRDNDSVPDALDGCPDQPGLTTNNGCPVPTPGDRDGDGVADSSDACPDQPGTTQAEGCPDADSDGVRDSVDACPHEPGTAERNGCPAPGDADSDGVPDASDACPSEAGSAALGGCPDRDADGVRDSDDACPDEAGPGSTRGCPDRDGDGVRDMIDLCPTIAGPASNNGCPITGAGDRDGDGIRDDVDLCPEERGLPEHGGCPAPGGGTDSDGDGTVDAEDPPEDPAGGLFDFSRLFFPMYTFTTVEVQALEFQVTHSYTSVYCYASLAGSAEEQIGPFVPLDQRHWDIAAYLGPLHSRTLFVPLGQPLQVRVECSGISAGSREAPAPGGGIGEGGGSEAYFDLGSIAPSHTVGASTIIEETVDSRGGSAGHSFRVKYRVCTPGCKTAVLRAPQIRLTHVSGMNFLWWEWPGQSYDINGFRLYRNGNYMFSRQPRDTFYRFPSELQCGQRYDIQLTAYRGNPGHPDAESPRSNIVTWEGPPCQRTVTVTFESFKTGDLDGQLAPGPLYGSFWAGDERRDFDNAGRVIPNSTVPMTHFLSRSRTEFTVDLGLEDSLYIAARIVDRDPFRDDVLFASRSIIPPAEITTGEYYTMTNRGNKVVVQITVTPRP